MGNSVKNIAIISGVSGMTGNETARKLLKQNYHVIGFDNFFASNISVLSDIIDNTRFKFFEYDLNNSEQMTNLYNYVKTNFPSNNYRLHFINCAAVVHTKYFYNPDSTFLTNVASMKSFLENAIKIKAETFLNCSTSEVYSMNSWESGGVKESNNIVLATSENTMRTSYAVGKLLTEYFTRDANDKNLIKSCSLRFANVYSPTETEVDHIIPYIISNLIKNSSVTLLENSKKNRRTFLHNNDSCSAIIKFLGNIDKMDGTSFNVGTSEEIKILDLVKIIASELELDNYEINFDGFRSGDPERRLLNTDKIKNTINWEPTVELRVGIKQCVQNFLNTN